MTIEDTITALEKYTRKVNPAAVFVLQKEAELCKFKAYKRFRYTLWYIDKLRNKNFPIYTLQNVARITSAEEEEAVVKQLEMEFMTFLFEYIRGEKFNLILGGSYEGDECISNIDN